MLNSFVCLPVSLLVVTCALDHTQFNFHVPFQSRVVGSGMYSQQRHWASAMLLSCMHADTTLCSGLSIHVSNCVFSTTSRHLSTSSGSIVVEHSPTSCASRRVSKNTPKYSVSHYIYKLKNRSTFDNFNLVSLRSAFHGDTHWLANRSHVCVVLYRGVGDCADERFDCFMLHAPLNLCCGGVQLRALIHTFRNVATPCRARHVPPHMNPGINRTQTPA